MDVEGIFPNASSPTSPPEHRQLLQTMPLLHPILDGCPQSSPSNIQDNDVNRLADPDTSRALPNQLDTHIATNCAELLHATAEIDHLKQKINYISHQMAVIMRALHVDPCQCAQCCLHQIALNTSMDVSVPVAVLSNNDNKLLSHTPNANCSSKMGPILNDSTGANGSQPIGGQSSAGTEEVDCAALLAKLFSSCQPVAESASTQQNSAVPPAEPQQNAAVTLKPVMEHGYATQNSEGVLSRAYGRRHKHYKSIEERNEIAEYGRVHGASAAARHYDIPVYAAQYYVRTHSRFDHAAKVGDSAENGLKSKESNSPNETELVSPMNLVDLRKRMSPLPESSKGVRTRGRPRLLGDELDAELLDYLIKVKRSLPGGHLTVSNALDLSREFIQQRSPGLLVEFGGEVSLRLSWASVLVRRIAEREGEYAANVHVSTPPEDENKCAGQCQPTVSPLKRVLRDSENCSPVHKMRTGNLENVSLDDAETPHILDDTLHDQLINYLTQVKYSMELRGERLSALTLVGISREFLKRYAPDVLRENGGLVELKLPWAQFVLEQLSQQSGHTDKHHSNNRSNDSNEQSNSVFVRPKTETLSSCFSKLKTEPIDYDSADDTGSPH